MFRSCHIKALKRNEKCSDQKMNGRGNTKTYEYLRVDNLENRIDDIKDNKNKASPSFCYQTGRKNTDQRKKEITEGSCKETHMSTQLTIKEHDIGSRISNLEKRVTDIEKKTNTALKVNTKIKSMQQCSPIFTNKSQIKSIAFIYILVIIIGTGKGKG